jgi:hypothetical protein
MINSFLCSFANDLDNRLLSNDLIIIRNQGVDQVGHLEHKTVMENQGDCSSRWKFNPIQNS